LKFNDAQPGTLKQLEAMSMTKLLACSVGALLLVVGNGSAAFAQNTQTPQNTPQLQNNQQTTTQTSQTGQGTSTAAPKKKKQQLTQQQKIQQEIKQNVPAQYQQYLPAGMAGGAGGAAGAAGGMTPQQ
jgi:hypothetical protein